MRQLPKTFEHAEVDPKWYAFWEEIGAFRADPASRRPPFCMVLPPPNVTGWLHIGHALNQTLHDVIARWKRMCGFDVLWLPGTDHAGIATQNVVEKQLAREGKSRHDVGRQAFEARVWDWVGKSRGTITSQMRKLGASVDWSRERFTLDEDLSLAVRRVFVTLYHDNLIYRAPALVSWCPRCRTALSDLEVAHQPTRGKLWHIRYPFAVGGGAVTVATTRPETMLGDTAVAVHPEDARFAGLVGTSLTLPVLGRTLPVIADPFVDPSFGTGAVKVTPGHDPNDFAIGTRHDLEQISVIDEDGRMTAAAGPYAGLDRFEARARLVEALEADGLLDRVEDHEHAVGQCQRCGTVVEPLLSTQWFVRIAPLAEPALAAVTATRDTKFVPENWTRTYTDWMTNIHDWCISRQLWWGHRIPAWYCDACGKTHVAEAAPEACACGGALTQEQDVLDTWFSSGLWPFSTMGWPDETDDLGRYYPTTLLVTAHDIIFFWVARMMMLGLRFRGDVPFRTVYITSLVRDEHGRKMSKSKGNVVDPLEVMGEIGADAFRFTLAALASPGMDISLSEGRLRAYRQFINKIWNASRFVLMQIEDGSKPLAAGASAPTSDDGVRPGVPPAQSLGLIHRWILHRVSALAAEVGAALEEYRFDVAADRLYHVFWHEYADWYIELVKPELQVGGGVRARAVAVLLEVHDRLLRMLHPFIPFVTEEVWQTLPCHGETIARSAFPKPVDAWRDDDAVTTMTLLQDVVTTIRTARSEWNVPPRQPITVAAHGADAATADRLRPHLDHVARLAGLASFTFADTAPAPDPETVRRVVRDFELRIPLSGIVDRAQEAHRVARDLEKLAKQRTSLQMRLGNASFLERADPDIVRQTREQEAAAGERQQKLERILAELAP